MTRLTLRAFGPTQSAPNQTQALRAAFGAMVGLLFTQAALWGLGHGSSSPCGNWGQHDLAVPNGLCGLCLAGCLWGGLSSHL